MDLMTNWLTAGEPFDAVFANNDEMAIGAIQAMKSAGVDMDDVIVVGVDATQDGLAAMGAGDLDVTVFQNAAGQAAGAVDAALALARGEAVDQSSTSRSSWSRPTTWTTYPARTEAQSRTGRCKLCAVSRTRPGAVRISRGHHRTPDHAPVARQWSPIEV